MVTIKNKYILLAAGFWLSGIALMGLGAYGKSHQWETTGTLLSVGIAAQAIGFGFLGFAIMQAVFKKIKQNSSLRYPIGNVVDLTQ
ncbi:hypothetical protein [Spirosoma sp.]|uniref:hypothetical protein n=1 Tax=Spirosoma sp. TaxID=1899569 RepID=UPI003B3A8B33